MYLTISSLSLTVLCHCVADSAWVFDRVCVSVCCLSGWLAFSDRVCVDSGIVGTPGYIAPEVISHKTAEIDQRADMWGLGVLLFVLLSAESPWPLEDASKELILGGHSLCLPRSVCFTVPASQVFLSSHLPLTASASQCFCHCVCLVVLTSLCLPLAVFLSLCLPLTVSAWQRLCHYLPLTVSTAEFSCQLSGCVRLTVCVALSPFLTVCVCEHVHVLICVFASLVLVR